MTRESRARALAFATAALVVLLAAVFAAVRNLTPASPPRPSSSLDQRGDTAAGRAVFVELGCAGCHSAEGRGNPAMPLDGVGARLDRERLRAAAFGTAAGLPAGLAEVKRGRAGGTNEAALLDFLQQLK